MVRCRQCLRGKLMEVMLMVGEIVDTDAFSHSHIIVYLLMHAPTRICLRMVGVRTDTERDWKGTVQHCDSRFNLNSLFGCSELISGVA